MSRYTYIFTNNHLNRAKSSKRRRDSRSARERGVALLITLGLLALLGAASLAVIFLTQSDTMINGYYRNNRGSFYAADSGINIVVEAMKNAVAAGATPANAGSTPPLSVTGSLVSAGATGYAPNPATLTAAYAPYLGSMYQIGDTGSWNSQFQVVANPGSPAPAILGTPTYTYSIACNGDSSCPGDGTGVYTWVFQYPYEITVQGQSSGSEAEEVTESGVIQYSSSPGSAAGGGLPSFSHFAGFIDQFSLCQGALVPGTMYGPFFTNGSWNFGNYSSPGYTFEGSIGQAGSQVGWINGGCSQGTATAPRGFHQPNFTQGFGINQPQITEPTDSYNQEEAVLDAKGCTSVPCSSTDQANIAAEMPSVLQTVNGTAYSSSTTGVFLPMHPDPTVPGQMDFGGNPTVTGSSGSGGFLVNGNASVTLTASTDSAHNPTQTYTITQGSGHSTTTTTIVVDPTANNGTGTTTVTQGSGTPLTLVGVPTQINPTSGATITQTDPSGANVAPTMVYVNGTITGLSGTIQNNTGITVTSSSNVDITGNLTYVSQPVTSTDSLVSNTNAGVLGIYTNGDVNLEPSSNGGNLTIDASIAMIGSGSSGLETPGNAVGTLTIMGGRSEDQAHGVNMSASNTMYDQRFAGNFGPPWFPTAVPTAGTPSVPSSLGITVHRTSWQQTSLQ
jgi:Tfp pilus assembly protein PilX